MIYESLLEEIDRGRKGENQGISTGIDKLDNMTGGLLKKNYTLIIAASGVAKSSLMLYSYVYRPIMEHLNDDNLRIYLCSLEMSANMVSAKLLSTYIFETYHKRLSVNDILSRKKGKILSDEDYAIVTESLGWLAQVESKVEIYDKSLNAAVLYKLLMKDLETRGNFTESENRITYIPNNPDLTYQVIIDHISLVQPRPGNTLKQEIDDVSKYLLTLRNRCGISPTIIQQINRDASSMDRRKFNLSDVRMSDASDSANPSKDCEVMLGIFSPHKERLNSYVGYDITKLEDNFRGIQVLKSRYGASDFIIPCNFFGDINMWHDLPKPDEIYDYSKYQSPDYIIQDENESLDQQTINFQFTL